MDPLIVVQARTGSTRFPGKTLAPLSGKPVIKRVLDACNRTGLRTVVTFPISDAGGPLPAYMAMLGQRWHTALNVDEDDVLGRFAAVVREYPQLTTIVRITADCPLIDHRTIVEMVKMQATMEGCAYLGRANCPDGNDVEVFTTDFLLAAFAKTPKEHRQHVVNWLTKQPDQKERVFHWEAHDKCRDVKYSVDTPDDLATCARLLKLVGESSPWQSYVQTQRTVADLVGA